MCGIAGIVDFNGKYHADLQAIVNKMSAGLKHRGPDDEGIFIEDKLGIVHRRLSIIDLSPAGHQPMCNSNHDIWITYNGEIYNYIEIRQELKSYGRNFISNTDTEVIIQAYEQWGEDCLSRFNGMWAFVIYDKRKNILFASRDRFGVKPFYYYHDKDIFLFASEHKALLAPSIIKANINNKAAFNYLVLGKLETDEESMFQSIYELPPSHAFTLCCSTGQLKKRKYYTLKYTDTFENYHEQKAEKHTAQVNKLLINAVKIRLRSDVEVGCCLSGGLDSSAIAGAIRKIRLPQNSKLKVFTSAYKNSSIDESRWSKQMAEYVGAEPHLVFPLANGLIENLEELVYAQDIPFLTTSTYAQFCVMKLVKDCGIKVTLDGQGGDEIFAGYDPHFISYWFELLRRGKFKILLNEWNVNEHSLVNRNILKYNLIKYLVLTYAPRFFIEYIYSGSTEHRLLNKDFWQDNKENLHATKPNIYSSLNQQLFEHVCGTHLKLMLRTNERNAMHHSVESRQPFADDLPLIEFMFQQPSAYKIHNKQSKHLLRLSLKGIIPEEIRLRKDKLGFTAPESKWMYEIKNELAEYFTNDLNQYFDVKKTKLFLNKYYSNENVQPNPTLWRMINFAVLKKVFK